MAVAAGGDITDAGSARRMCVVVLALLLALAAQSVRAQELEPKAYAASPVGAAFLVLGFARSTGGVVTDPTLPISDVDATAYLPMAAVGYSFGMGGKLALVTAALPYAWADVSGNVFEEARTVSLSGLADTRLKLSVNLRGNDAMGARAFARAPRRTIVGTSVTVTAPSGQIYADKLVNVGLGRWAVKPEVGVAVPRGRWDFDGYAGVWLFAANDNYYPGGRTRDQQPLFTVQVHASYTFRPKLWLALDSTWYGGGAAILDDGPAENRMNNARLGLTLSLPVARLQSLKVAYNAGAIVRTGNDFRTVSVAWTCLWLTKP